MGADLDKRRKRLLFRSLRRGTKESDYVLGEFARAHLSTLGDAELDCFEALLDRNDPDVLAWVIGLESPPAEFDTELLAMIRKFRNIRHHIDS
jgi:antitoxin CptB